MEIKGRPGNSLNTSSCCSQIYFGFGAATRQRKKNKTGQIRADRKLEGVRLIRDRRYITAYVYPFDGRMAALRDKASSPSFPKKSRAFTRALVLASCSYGSLGAPLKCLELFTARPPRALVPPRNIRCVSYYPSVLPSSRSDDIRESNFRKIRDFLRQSKAFGI